MKKYKILAGFIAAIMCVATIPPLSEMTFITSYAVSEKLSAPSGFKAASTTKSSIKLTWNKVKGADAYRVYVFNSDTDEYESYKTVTGTECTVKALTAGKTYKFKVAALIKENGKYKVQIKYNKISVKTKSSSTRTTPSEFNAPDIGEKRSKVLKECGITDYSKVASLSDSTSTVYRGTVIFWGIKSELYLHFNKDDRLYMYLAKLPISRSEYSKLLSSCKDSFGYDYTTDYNSNNDLYYYWLFSKMALTIGYNSNHNNMVVSEYYYNYAP